jgi:hypothetical protein
MAVDCTALSDLRRCGSAPMITVGRGIWQKSVAIGQFLSIDLKKRS